MVNLGQSGALSLLGWSQSRGIDGVVMRDGDVREQTPFQGCVPSSWGQLEKCVDNHHLCSLTWILEGDPGEDVKIQKEGTVEWGSQT